MHKLEDYEKITNMIFSLLKDLSKNEINNLLNGDAYLKYIETKRYINKEKIFYKDLLHEGINCPNKNSLISFLYNSNLKNKIQLTEFCDYLGLVTKSKDKKEEIIEKIADFILNNKEIIKMNTQNDRELTHKIDDIGVKLKGMEDISEAYTFLKNEEILNKKSNLLLLAKNLDVYIKKELPNDIIMTRIVESVVGSKLRSLAIRGKSKD
jgi:hypothetical protein